MKGWSLLGALLLGTLCLGLMSGQVWLGPRTLWEGLWSGTGPGALTLRHIRGPSVATALGAGAVLGASGAVLQSLLRNPLAAPDVMGFGSGAGLAVIGAVFLNWAAPMALAAALGGLAAAALVAILAWRPGAQGRDEALTMVLVGLGVGLLASAASSFLILRLEPRQAMEAQRWLTGSLAARDWGHVAQVFGMGAGLAALLALQSRGLGLLELGDDMAAGLGARVRRTRLGLAATAVLLAAAGVAVAGPIPFVALMAAPIAARLVRTQTPQGRVLASAGTGALIMLCADCAARAAIRGVELPVGVMTGIFGAPYLLWLIRRDIRMGKL